MLSPNEKVHVFFLPAFLVTAAQVYLSGAAFKEWQKLPDSERAKPSVFGDSPAVIAMMANRELPKPQHPASFAWKLRWARRLRWLIPPLVVLWLVLVGLYAGA